MKKLLLGIIITAAAIVFGGNYYYTQKIEQQLNKTAVMLQQMGGDLKYGEVNIDLHGDIHVKNIYLKAPVVNTEVNMRSLIVHTDGVMGVYRIARDARNRRFPEQLGVSVKGVRLPASTQVMENSGFMPAACRPQQTLKPLAFSKMGFTDFLVDSHIDYHIVGGGELLTVNSNSAIQHLYHINSTFDFSLGAPSRKLMAVAQALPKAKLFKVTLNYKDQGYIQRLLNYCEKQTDLNRAEVIKQHLAAWQAAWKDRGLVAGPHLVKAYRRYVQNPDSIKVKVKPSTDLTITALKNPNPSLLNTLDITVSVNDGPFIPLDLSPMTHEQQQAWKIQQPEKNVFIPTTHNSAKKTIKAQQPLAREHWQEHLNKSILLELNSGKTMSGRLKQLGEQYLQLQIFQSGGYIIRPVAYSDIKHLFLVGQTAQP